MNGLDLRASSVFHQVDLFQPPQHDIEQPRFSVDFRAKRFFRQLVTQLLLGMLAFIIKMLVHFRDQLVIHFDFLA